jgi:site-specific DNA-methyltransferase (adenine-specific)
MDLLPIELKDLQGMDFNLDLLGFSADDLASMLSPEGAAAGLTDPDAVPEPPTEPVTKPGDLWLLGRVVRCPKCRRLTDV